jgi:parvulin-like peptidyl-prolyl isomerase
MDVETAMDRKFLCLTCLALLTLTARVPAAAPPIVMPEDAAAVVNGQSIPEAVVKRALERVSPARRAEVRPGLLDHLINNLLIDQHLRATGYKVGKAEVDKRVEQMKEELEKAGRDFDKMLAELKVPEAELRAHIAADLRWYKYASAQGTDEVLKKLFTKEKEAFDGSTVKTRHILLTPRESGDKAGAAAIADLRKIKAAIEKDVKDGLAKLPDGTDAAGREKQRQRLLSEAFAKQAKENSDCPSKAKGGELAAFPKSGFMVAPFADAAFALKPYEMSDAVQTSFGYHLILCVERKPGREVKFEDVKAVVKEVYFDRLNQKLAAQLRRKAVVLVRPAAE